MMKHPVNVTASSRAETPQPNLVEDVGGSGESPAGVKFHSTQGHQTSAASAHETGSGDLSPFDTTPGIFPTIGYWILRIVFYVAIFGTLFIGSVYLAKLTGVYDVCDGNTYITTKCETEPYASGFLYYVECKEESFCLLPGFWSTSYTAGWSLTKPENKKPTIPEESSAVDTPDKLSTADEGEENTNTNIESTEK